MSSIILILCLYGGTIINNNNGNTYNGESIEFLIAILDMSLINLSRILYDWLGWNMSEITWRMLQIRVNQALYVGVPIYSDESVNLIFEFARITEINILELYFMACHIRWCGARYFTINLTHDFFVIWM
jgi:hypothetical protein